jgi:8-oxo-dGTP pyrophosphatase MutT (NUDIX family)
MNFDYDPSDRQLPQADVHGLEEFDAEGDRVRQELGWTLAAFTVLFDADCEWCSLVRLGYAEGEFGAKPWCLPGGAVQGAEAASEGAVREVREETGLSLSSSELLPAGWLARPYYVSPRQPAGRGELVLLYSGFANPDDPRLRPSPPETVAAAFAPFRLEKFLTLPVDGEGDDPFSPLAGRHWAWWIRVGQLRLQDQLRHPVVWTYQSKEDLSLPPWPGPPPQVVEHTQELRENEPHSESLSGFPPK